MKSGWDIQGSSAAYYSIRRAKRFKDHSALELSADTFQQRAFGQNAPSSQTAERHSSQPALADDAAPSPQPIVTTAPAKTAAEIQAQLDAKKADIAKRKARNYEVAMRFA